MSKYEELAARRFRQYKWEKRKSAIEARIFALSVQVFQASVPMLERVGLTRRRAVERIDVE